MAQMIISSSELRKKKEALEGLKKVLSGQIQQLEETAGKLHGMWEGDAKESFVKSFKTDTDSLRKVLDVITDFLIVLEKIISIYMMMEAKNVQTAGGRS